MTTATKARTKKVPTTIQENLLENGQLRCQVGARIRLSNQDREILRKAYHDASVNEKPAATSNGYITTVTNAGTPSLDKRLGFNSIVWSHLIASRDPLPLGMVLKIQDVLGVEIVSHDYLQGVFDSYIQHIRETNLEPTDD